MADAIPISLQLPGAEELELVVLRDEAGRIVVRRRDEVVLVPSGQDETPGG